MKTAKKKKKKIEWSIWTDWLKGVSLSMALMKAPPLMECVKDKIQDGCLDSLSCIVSSSPA